MSQHETKNSILINISNYIQILTSYKLLFDTEIIPNREKWIERFYIIIQDTRKEHFDNLLDTETRELELIKQLLLEYKHIQEQLANTKELNPQYLNLVFQELSNEGNLEQLKNEINQIIQSLPRLQKDEMDFNVKQNSVFALNSLLNNHRNLLQNILNNLTQLRVFDYFKDISKNTVIIGANGSGKSSFARKNRTVLGNNLTIIAAQKIFNFNSLTSLPLGNEFANKLEQFHNDDKLCKKWKFL